MERRSHLLLEVNGPRPPYATLADHLWGANTDFDSDGNSRSADDRHWTELMIQRRDLSKERVEIEPVAESPLVLKVVASSPALARRATEFLQAETNGRLVEGL